MLKIRLMRIGAKSRPFYRVVAVDERNKRTGGYIELLGTYNPLTNPHEIKLKQDRIDYWVKQGAQLSDGFLRITGKAPPRPPRKAKKEKIEKVAEKPQEVTEVEKTSEVEPKEQIATEPEAPHSDETPTNTSDGGTEGDSSKVDKTEESEKKDEGSA